MMQSTEVETPTENVDLSHTAISIPVTQTQISNPRMIVLFDGVCNVCNNFVQFLYPRDVNQKLWFQAQQTAKGRELLLKYGQPLDLNTVILIDEAAGKAYARSDAIFRICAELGNPWYYASYLVYIPRPLRDFGYNSFSSVRYLFFGKKDTCGYFPDLRDRFVDFRSPIIEENSTKEF
eukprot:TRINITY_DN535_c0_g1_i3.p1 TRINITY_DN535_c0_g1~~TRINITY_DN535_c0_g1_i3.p1  ORF type:complete len:178 (-),score=28.31 TRINITY_DN535_c0_g1_i3:362-895(-)